MPEPVGRENCTVVQTFESLCFKRKISLVCSSSKMTAFSRTRVPKHLDAKGKAKGPQLFCEA